MVHHSQMCRIKRSTSFLRGVTKHHYLFIYLLLFFFNLIFFFLNLIFFPMHCVS